MKKKILKFYILFALMSWMACTGSDDLRITEASPDSATADGGTLVTFTGENFKENTIFMIGDVPCKSSIKISDTKMSCIAGIYPAQQPTKVEVVAINPDGEMSTLQKSFVYQP